MTGILTITSLISSFTDWKISSIFSTIHVRWEGVVVSKTRPKEYFKELFLEIDNDL